MRGFAGFVFCFFLVEGQHQQQQQQQPRARATPVGVPPGFTDRFEYKYSFKPPYLAQKDGSVPFFEYSGNAIASSESVRITPSLRSQKGMIWNKALTNFDWWKVEMIFRVTGRGRIGADGLAFWYTANKGVEGPVFGSSDKWNGLGVFFDSFDNDNKHNNPYISAVVNDGSIAYDHQNDGVTQQLAGCLRDFRNKPFPVRAAVIYHQNVLTVHINNGVSNDDNNYELCLRVENIILPANGYFGISAATGGLADDHDVLRFSVSSLRQADLGRPAEDAESQKFQKEFDQYQQKLKEQKDQWAAEHPDQVKQDPDDWNNWFSDSDKELNQIYQGQASIREALNALHRKMDDMLNRQAMALGQAGGPPPGGAPQFQGNLPPIDSIRRDEVNSVLANQREMLSLSRDIKNFVTDIHSKSNQLINRGSSQQIGGGGVGGEVVQEVRDSINVIKRDLNVMSGKECPQSASSSCVSTTFFIVLMLVQLVVLISYLMFRDSREAKAKKFY